MLMRVVVAAGAAALLGGCVTAPPSVLPTVRDGSLPEAAGSPPEPAAVRSERSGRRVETTYARAGIPRPRPAEAPPVRLEKGETGAAPVPRVEDGTPKESSTRAGVEGETTPGEGLAVAGLPEEEATREGNSAVAALLESARAAERARQYGRASAALERALKVEPRNPRLWHRLAAVRYRQGRHREAEALARRSMSLSPTDAMLDSRNWRVIAAARHGQGDEEGAREALRRANAP